MNLLPLDTFRRILKYNPYHFWGLAGPAVPVDSQCNTVVAEYAYQSNNAGGRDDIRQAIEYAEQKLRAFLGYPVAPMYLEATVPYPSYLDQRFVKMWPSDPTGGWISVMLPDQYVQAIGVESLTPLSEVNVSYSDQFGSGVYDTFTITVPTTETDPKKIAVYFAESDRFDDTKTSERWRIQPVHVSISSGIATITGRAWLLVKPILYQKFTRVSPLDPANPSNFVTKLAVYLRTTNPDGKTEEDAQGVFIWDTVPLASWWGFCCSTYTDPAATAKSIARVGIRGNGIGGIVLPGEAIYNTNTNQWSMTNPPWPGICRPPQKVKIRYLAGYPLSEEGQMDSRLANAVAYLAMANMSERICACDNANRTLWRYQLPLNQTGNQQETFAVSREMLNNPLGNRYGDWLAWNEIKNLRLPRGAQTG